MDARMAGKGCGKKASISGTTGLSPRPAKAGSFETMTQEQGTKLEGLFTSGQIHWANMDTTLDGMGDDISEGLDCLRNIEPILQGALLNSGQ